jgi:hypothetical protein
LIVRHSLVVEFVYGQLKVSPNSSANRVTIAPGTP